MNEVIISGKIEEYPIENIIQVLNQDKKDGLLVLEFKSKKAEIYFNSGDIVFVSVEGFKKENTIENYLRYRHRMKNRDIKEIREFGKQYGYTFEQSLVAGKYIEKDEAYEIIKSYFEDLLCTILTFKSGKYRFELVNKIKKIDTIRIPSNFILMEAGRRLDMKKMLLTSLKSSKSVFAIIDKKKLFKDKFNRAVVEQETSSNLDKNLITSSISDDGIEPDELENISFQQVKSDDKKTKILRDVVEVVNGVNNVVEIVRYSGWGDFRVWEVLSDLYLNGYIEIIGEKEESVKIEDEIHYSTKDRAKFAFVSVILLSTLFLLFLLRFIGIGNTFLNFFSFKSDKIIYNRLVTRSLRNFYKEKVENGKKIYYIINKSAPINIKILEENMFISPNEYKEIE